MPKSASTKVFRSCNVTVNNPTADDRKHIRRLPVKYSVIGEEVGDSGTPHLQCYFELEKQMRFKALKKYFPRGAIFPRDGTAKQCSDYCKKDGKFVEKGTISNPGKRTDLESVYHMAKERKSDIEIGEAHPGTYLKYYKAIDRVKFNYDSQDTAYQPVTVSVIWGPAGSGKTRQAHTVDPKLFCLDHTGTIWFDGYKGQDTLLLDDFYGGIKYEYLLRLLDGYRFALPIKGGHTWKKWTRVIITSNSPPEMWYAQGLSAALERRISSVEELVGA